jgi:ADP-heptose:LPS heptosyltransferase
MKEAALSETWVRRWNHRRLDWMRAKKLQLMHAVFDRCSVLLPEPQGPLREFLVLRLDDKLGDSITATGFLRELKKAFPTSRLTVVAGALTSQIYQGQVQVDEVILSRKGLAPTLKLFFRLRKKSYDVIINTSHLMTPRTVFLLSRLRARRKLGFLCKEYRLFTEHVEYDATAAHVTERYKKTLQALDVRVNALPYELSIPTAAFEKSEKHLQPWAGKKLVILNSFAGAWRRSLNEENSRAIARGILQANSEAIVISIGNHNDLPVIARWIEAAKLSRWICFPEATDFFENCALISRASLVISPDTAIVHVASALERPQVAIFRPDGEEKGAEKNSQIWAPLPTAKAAVKVVYSLKAAADGDEPNINDMKVDEIVREALTLLK